MTDGRVRVGATGENFAALARDLRRVAARELQRELYSGLQRAGKETIDGVRQNASNVLPQSGGLAERVADGKWSLRQMGAQRGGTFRIRLSASARNESGKEMDLASSDAKGVVRHPLYGHRKHWYSTQVPVGWFSEPAARLGAQSLEPALRGVIDAIDRQISGR